MLPFAILSWGCDALVPGLYKPTLPSGAVYSLEVMDKFPYTYTTQLGRRPMRRLRVFAFPAQEETETDR